MHNNKSTSRETTIWKNELLTVTEVAAYFRVSRVTVWRWCQRGIIPAFQIGRAWRIRSKDLLNLEIQLKQNQHALVSNQLEAEKKRGEE